MIFKSKKYSLLILGATSLVCSRLLFSLFNDPEGPNLLVVTVMAAILYAASLTIYAFGSPAATSKRFWLAILIQIILVTGLYFFLR
jgi:hypothetical protein